jgi:hypothetical protein
MSSLGQKKKSGWLSGTNIYVQKCGKEAAKLLEKLHFL